MTQAECPERLLTGDLPDKSCKISTLKTADYGNQRSHTKTPFWLRKVLLNSDSNKLSDEYEVPVEHIQRSRWYATGAKSQPAA